jgi:hypothetical protein
MGSGGKRDVTRLEDVGTSRQNFATLKFIFFFKIRNKSSHLNWVSSQNLKIPTGAITGSGTSTNLYLENIIAEIWALNKGIVKGLLSQTRHQTSNIGH